MVTPQGGTPPRNKYNKGHIVIPYTQGLGENIKVNKTIKRILVKPEDKDPLNRRSGAIYWYQCGELACSEEYIGEKSRTLGERYKKHLKEPSPLFGHNSQSGHSTNPDNFTIIGREDHGLARTIKESIYIMVNNPTLNMNVGKYNLHHLWDIVLFNILDLKVSNDNGQAHRTSFNGHAQSSPTNRHMHRTTGHIGHAHT